jgi:hypothetical protein
MKGNNKAKETRLKVAEPRRSQVKYTDAIDRVNRMKKWREWEGLESGANKTLKYHGRIYRRDIPYDEEKLMTNMINQMNYKKKLRENKKIKITASIMVNMHERDSEDDDGGDEGAGVPRGEGINMSEG